MSSLWLNLRLGGLFIQWNRGDWTPRFRYRPIVVGYRPREHEPWAELYELRWPW